MTRKKASIERTILCATRFWSMGWRTRDNKIGTLRGGVRHVVRKQGFTTAAIVKAERALVKAGKIELKGKGSGATIRLTDRGNRVSCARVKLAPWTNAKYKGSELTGGRRKRRR